MANIQMYNLDTILQAANPIPNNLNMNGIWSVNDDASTTCNCGTITVGVSNQPVTGNYLFIDDTCFDAIVASGTPCDITLTYTVEDVCTTISIHTLTLNPATCPNNITMTSNNPVDIAMLRLERLVYNGTTPTNYVYKVVDNTNGDATCESTGLFFVVETDGTYTAAELASLSGCGYNPTLNPNQVLIVLDDINTYEDFDVPVGNYAAFICYCGDCGAGACELYDCCGQTQSIDIALRTLCDGGTQCTSILRSYNGANYIGGSTNNFVIKIPFKVIADKCIYVDFNGDTTLADTVKLRVLDINDTYQEMDINLTDNANLGFTSTGLTQFVVRASTTTPLPYQPYITITPKNVSGYYIFEFEVSSATTTGITNWSVDISCCNCLTECPPKEYFCIDSIEKITPANSNNCYAFKATYHLGNYTTNPQNTNLVHYINGKNCSTTNYCAMGKYIIGNFTSLFGLPVSVAYGEQSRFSNIYNIPSSNNLCATTTREYPNEITYAIDKITIVFALTTDYNDFENEIISYSGNYDNKFLILSAILDTCDDTSIVLMPEIKIPLVQNIGSVVYKAKFVFTAPNEVELTFINIADNTLGNIFNMPLSTCYHNIEAPTMSSDILYNQIYTNPLPINPTTYNNTYYTNKLKALTIDEKKRVDTLINHNNNNYFEVCPAFNNILIIRLLDYQTETVNNVEYYTNWIAYSSDVITNYNGVNYLTIFQIGKDVSAQINDLYTIDAYSGITEAIITVDTKILDGITNECYSPTV